MKDQRHVVPDWPTSTEMKGLPADGGEDADAPRVAA
jgi:hypothetical protein